MNDTLEQFRLAIAAAGLTPPTEIIDDGAIHRFSTNGKPVTNPAVMYCIRTASRLAALVTGAAG